MRLFLVLGLAVFAMGCQSQQLRSVANETPAEEITALSIKDCVNAGDELVFGHPRIMTLPPKSGTREYDEHMKKEKALNEQHEQKIAECKQIRAAVDCKSRQEKDKRAHIAYYKATGRKGLKESVFQDAAAALLYCSQEAR